MAASPQEQSLVVTLRRAAMDLLARREHGFEELRRKLATRFPELDQDADILPVLERLRDEKLQSDERFVEAYVHHCRARGQGPLKIQAELQQRQIESALMRLYLDDEPEVWRQQARAALLRKHPRLDLRQPRDYQRGYRFLAQRGFSSDDISAVLRALQRAGGGDSDDF